MSDKNDGDNCPLMDPQGAADRSLREEKGTTTDKEKAKDSMTSNVVSGAAQNHISGQRILFTPAQLSYLRRVDAQLSSSLDSIERSLSSMEESFSRLESMLDRLIELRKKKKVVNVQV